MVISVGEASGAAGDAATKNCDVLRGEVRDLIDRWRAQGRYVPRNDAWLRSFDLEFSRKLAAQGMIGMTWPVQYGGAQRTNVERLAVTEELLRAAAPVAAHWIGDRQIGPAILRHGSTDLRAEILPKICTAEAVFCLGMSEPDAGSDLSAVRTRAVRTSGGWLLRGRKVWTSHGHRATHAYVLARTSDDPPRHGGLSEFIVDMSANVTVTPIIDMAGSHHFNEVVFEDAFVPEHRLLGTLGQGWSQVVEQLSFERGGAERVLSTYPVLMMLLVEAARDRHSETIVGELIARLAVLRRLCFQVATAVDEGRAPVQDAAVLKFLGTEFENDVIDACRRLDVATASGPDSTFGQALLASPGFGLRGGASEVLLSLIARHEARL